MKTILVAEDFQTSRRVIVNALARNGYRSLEAADGLEALELFDGRPIDLLVTDFNMPKMNGAELIEAVRMKAQYKCIPVLVLTTELNHCKKIQAATAMITAWVTKPFDLERFMKLIDKSIK